MRRRLRWLAVPVVLGGAATAIALLVPDPAPINPNPGKNAPPAQLVTPVQVHVTAAERRAINATLDRFMPAALDRHDLATAWRLAGPELKGGSSLHQWEAGTTPFPHYPVAEKTFHHWTTIDAGPDYVVFNLLVHPRRGAQTSSWVFSGEMIKHGSRWLVNRLYTVATMAKPTKSGQHETGPADYAASAAPSQPAITKSRLGKPWLLIGVGIVFLVFFFPAAFLIGSTLRSRRRRRLYEQTRSHSLPPLPGSAGQPAGGPRN